MKPTVFFSLLIIMAGCNNPKREQIERKQEVITKELNAITDSLDNATKYNEQPPQDYQNRIKRLTGEIDSLNLVIKDL